MMGNRIADPEVRGATDANAPGGTRAKANQLLALALALLATALSGRLLLISYQSAAEPAHGFVSHYAASRLLLEGVRVPVFYDDARMVQEVQRFEPGVTDMFGANPPTMAFAALPVAWMDYPTARLTWTLLSAVAWLVAVFWLCRACHLPAIWTAGAVAIAAVFQPALEHMRHGQFHVLVLVLVLIAWRFLKRRPRRAGACLAIASVVKTGALLLWPMLVVRRRWRAIDSGVITTLLILLATIPFAGLSAWALFFYKATDLVQGGSFSVTAYQTVHSLVRRLTVVDSQWNPAPAFPFEYGAIAATVLAGVILVIALMLIDRRRDHDLAFAGFSALSLALLPQSLDYHYVLAMFPIVVLLSRLHDRPKSISFVLLGLATFMIAAALPHNSPRLADGAIAILAYPKLYGALILAGLCLFIPASATNEDEVSAPSTPAMSAGTSASSV